MKSNHIDEYVASGTSPTRTDSRKNSLEAGVVRVSLSPFQKYILRVLLFGAGKTVKDRGRICEVLDTGNQLRRLMPLVNEDLSEPNIDLFWVPRRPRDRKQMKEERIRRQYVSGIRVAFSGLHYTGQARPDADPVPVERIYREVPPETHRFLRHLGMPESRLTVIASWETRMMSVLTRLDNLKRLLRQQLNYKRKQFMENLVVETLRRSQMNDQRVAATYDVLVGGVALASAARNRGIDAGLLQQAVNRIARKVRPVVEDQLKVWIEQEAVGKTVADIDALEGQKVAMFTLPPDQTKSEWVASLR
jgi:hypothetical protein